MTRVSSGQFLSTSSGGVDVVLTGGVEFVPSGGAIASMTMMLAGAGDQAVTPPTGQAAPARRSAAAGLSRSRAAARRAPARSPS